MSPWLIYIKERFPIFRYLLIGLGLALSGASMAGRELMTASTFLCFLFAVWGFATLRLIDEMRNCEKDLLAIPWVSVARVIRHLMNVGWVFTVVFYVVSLEASMISTLTTAWLWLISKNFYLDRTLAKRPVIEAILRQIVLLPFCLLMALKTDDFTLGWSLAVLGAFFTYEVCLQLDPKAQPRLRSYLKTYGRQGVFTIVALLFAATAIGAKSIGYQLWMTPWAILTLAMCSLIWIRPTAFRAIETAAKISLFFHVWAPAINSLIAKFAALTVKL